MTEPTDEKRHETNILSANPELTEMGIEVTVDGVLRQKRKRTAKPKPGKLSNNGYIWQ